MKKRLFWAMLPLVVMPFFSCEDDEPDAGFDQSSQFQEFQSGEIRLGEKIPNPYSLSVMQQAYNELQGVESTRSGKKLEPTHLYLKFSPKNMEELRLLEDDTTLYFYDYPLDVELIGEGGDYRDPSLPIDVPTYQYVCVPADYELPNVEYEVLDEIYYQESGESTRNSDGLSWEELEEKAYELVGETAEKESVRSSKWRAGGYLYYNDNATNRTEPLTGVKVRMRYHIITYEACTDLNGYFESPESKRGDCKYSIEWKRAEFKIRPNTGLSTADYVIQENESRVNKVISRADNVTQWFYASIFRAAHFCYYADLHGLIRPESSLGLRASNASEKEGVGGNYITSGSTEIHIYRYLFGEERTSLGYYGVTIHELAHSMHCKLVGKNTFDCVEKNVKEAWTVAISNYFTLEKYNKLSWTYLDYNSKYSGIIDDLLDNDKRGKLLFGDFVSGYTLSQIQNALKGASNLDEFKNNIKKIKNNATENEKINQLFNYWVNY